MIVLPLPAGFKNSQKKPVLFQTRECLSAFVTDYRDSYFAPEYAPVVAE